MDSNLIKVRQVCWHRQLRSEIKSCWRKFQVQILPSEFCITSKNLRSHRGFSRKLVKSPSLEPYIVALSNCYSLMHPSLQPPTMVSRPTLIISKPSPPFGHIPLRHPVHNHISFAIISWLLWKTYLMLAWCILNYLKKKTLLLDLFT